LIYSKANQYRDITRHDSSPDLTLDLTERFDPQSRRRVSSPPSRLRASAGADLRHCSNHSDFARARSGRKPPGRVRLIVLCARTQQIIRVLTGIKCNGLTPRNTSFCDGVGRLRRKTFPTRNLIAVVKEQSHQSHRLDALDSNDLKFHLKITMLMSCNEDWRCQ
jgi:hypothetical protein